MSFSPLNNSIIYVLLLSPLVNEKIGIDRALKLFPLKHTISFEPRVLTLNNYVPELCVCHSKLSMILDQKTGEGWKKTSLDCQTAQFGHTVTLFGNTYFNNVRWQKLEQEVIRYEKSAQDIKN